MGRSSWQQTTPKRVPGLGAKEGGGGAGAIPGSVLGWELKRCSKRSPSQFHACRNASYPVSPLTRDDRWSAQPSPEGLQDTSRLKQAGRWLRMKHPLLKRDRLFLSLEALRRSSMVGLEGGGDAPTLPKRRGPKNPEAKNQTPHTHLFQALTRFLSILP